MNQPLLSLDSIKRISQYVELKFPHLPKEKHAEIVADTIAKVVDKQLPSFNNETKQTITYDIIKHIIIKQKRAVVLADIVQACDEHPLSKEEQIKYLDWKNDIRIENELDAHTQAEREEPIVPPQFQRTAMSEAAATLDSIPNINTKSNTKSKAVSIYYTFGFILLFVFIVIGYQFIRPMPDNVQVEELSVELAEPVSAYPLEHLPPNELPVSFQFEEFDKDTIKSYLNKRNSILEEDSYFDVIYNTAYDFNIHPVLLFAITGQEQGFVPRNHEYALKIAQNPFNVFYSWQDYNTTIEDTTAIAARTLVNLSKERPEGEDAIRWINRKYAEDKKWHEGVSSLFNTIVNHKTMNEEYE